MAKAKFSEEIRQFLEGRAGWRYSYHMEILGLTPVRRATVAALKLNRPVLLRRRRALVGVNRHPPGD